MQTFIPYEDIEQSAKVLDYRRLGKQRSECKQILNALYKGGGWKNHPAVKMWSGYENALTLYMNTVIIEWIRRGYKNNMLLCEVNENDVVYPLWLGDNRFHASHRSNLLRKDPKYYGQFGWNEPDNLPYFWPTKEGY